MRRRHRLVFSRADVLCAASNRPAARDGRMLDPRRRPMRSSRYFLPILRETPKEAEIVSHRLMLRAGLIRQQAAGIYSWLPLGLKVLNKIDAIVREEQDRAGAIEILMPTIQSADLWREMRALRRLRQGDAAHPRPARARDAVRPDQRGDGHGHLPRLRALLQGPAAQPLPYPVEVPRRGPAALRRHARARVPDEGRLFLRPRSRPARAIPTTTCSSPICALSRAWACKAIPDARRIRTDRRRHEPRIHHPGRDRRERSVLSQATTSTSPCRAPDTDFDDGERCSRSSTGGPSLYAATVGEA